MGGCASKPKEQPKQQQAAPSPVVEGQMIESPGVAPPAGKPAKGRGKGKGKKASKFQIALEGKFQDYEDQEDRILKRAYMCGQNNVRYELRGQKYEYNFKKMMQINRGTHKERKIRPPYGGPRPPKAPLLPTGPMIILAVKQGQPGTLINVKDPNNPGQMIPVYVPKHAKPGQKIAIPIPGKGETLDSVSKKQDQHDKDHGTKTGWSTGGKVAVGGAAVAGVAAVGVGGVILGDHLAGGEMASTIGEAAVDAGETIADGATDAVDAVGDWAPGAADAAGDWAEGAGEDIADFAGDAGDWLGDAGEDIGDFVMDLF